jgi:hypothetical protein
VWGPDLEDGQARHKENVMATHVKVLAVLYIALSSMGVLLGLLMLLIFFGAAGIVGATADPDAWIALPILGITGTALAAFFLIVSVPGIIAGIGLLKYRNWARILAIVLAVLNLLNIPFGTIVGIYALWVLFSKDTEALFTGRPAQSV